MKHIIKILLFILVSVLCYTAVNAAVDFGDVPLWDIEKHSIDQDFQQWQTVKGITDVGFGLFRIAKLIVQWVLTIFLVYIWIQMFLYMWEDEEELSNAKRQIYYTIIWIVFINIPGTLYSVFRKDNYWDITWWSDATWTSAVQNSVFFNWTWFTSLNDGLIGFIEVLIWVVALISIVMAWIKMMNSRWRDDEISEAKTKIVWSCIWLIFVWIMEAWQRFLYSGSIDDGVSLFDSVINLALFFAWPIAIFFISLAWYYYITANWDEEKVKKAKDIIINTLIATVILMTSYAFLLDLVTL